MFTQVVQIIININNIILFLAFLFNLMSHYIYDGVKYICFCIVVFPFELFLNCVIGGVYYQDWKGNTVVTDIHKTRSVFF